MTAGDAVLLTGATGYVGGHLLAELIARGDRVRVLARRPERVPAAPGVEVLQGDVVSGAGLERALSGVRVAYYLVHSMGRGSGPEDEFAERDRRAAGQFGHAARAAQVERVVYLGGLGPADGGGSRHLASRHEVAQLLGDLVPKLIYARAAMIIGAGSASYQMLDALVRRLPLMVTPRWVNTRTQPIAVRDVVGALADVAQHPDPPGELQLGGADVLSYREMMARLARVLGRRPPVTIDVPVLTPRLSSYWVTLLTPVELSLVRPLIDGLSVEMVVERPPPRGLNEHPLGFEAAARAALDA